MTHPGTPTEVFRSAVSALLGGRPPSDVTPAMVGSWGQTWADLLQAHAKGGTPDAIRTWDVLTKANPKLLTVVSSEPATGSDAWTAPLPFVAHDVPVFPVDVFPPWLRAYVAAEAEAKQVPLDLVAMLALSVLSTACARQVAVEARPGYIEPVNLFTVTALPPASRKSATFAALTAPIMTFEREQMRAGEAARDEAVMAHEVLEARLADAKRDAAKAKTARDQQDTLARANDLAEQLREHTIPPIPRLVVDDISSEMLASMLAEHGGRIAALSPEGDIFSIMAGRYSGDAAPNFGVYLKAHAGDDLRVDRRSRKSEMVQMPALTMGLTVQPAVIRSFGDKAAMRGLGLLGRVLFALPVPTIGHRTINPAPVPDAVRTTYHQHALRLLRDPQALVRCHSGNCGYCGTPEADSGDSDYIGSRIILDTFSLSLLKLTEAAQALLIGWETWLEPHLAEDAAFGWLADWAGKLTGAIVRIAGLLHLADLASHNTHNAQNCPRTIEANVVARAIAVGRYLIPHAQAAFGEMQANAALPAARRVLAWLTEQQRSAFTKRAAWQGLKGSNLFRAAADLDPVLELLTYHAYIRPVEMDERAGAGRKPSQRYEVNPLLWQQARPQAPTQAVTPFAASYVPPEATDDDSGGYRGVEGY